MRKRWLRFFLIASFAFFLSHSGLAVEESKASGVIIRTPAAEYDEQTGKIVAQNSTIEWRGVKVICPSIEVDTRTQEVRGSGTIDILWEDFKGQAKSLFYRRSDNILSLSEVSGGNPEIRFSAQAMNLDFTQEVVRLLGSPTFQARDLVVQAKEVWYFFVTGKTWQARTVNLEKGEWKGKAEKAQYSPLEKYVLLEEQAQVWKGENILRGERIRLDLQTGQVKVEGDVEINLVP